MAELDLAGIMDAIARTAVLSGIVKRAYAWPTLDVSPPALIVGYPTELNYDATMARGSDRAVFPVWVVCGKIDARSTRDIVAAYVSPAGARGVHDALSGDLGGVVQTCRVRSMTIEATTINSVDYTAPRFDLDILT